MNTPHIKVAVSGLRMLRSAFAALLALEPDFRVVELQEAQVIIELKIIPAPGIGETVVSAFAVVSNGTESSAELDDEAYIGFHEEAPLLIAGIRQSAGTGEPLLN